MHKNLLHTQSSCVIACMTMERDPATFLDCQDDLGLLEARWAGGQAELVVVWGCRRVGKMELLSRFVEGRRGILFEATAGTTADQLLDLTRVLAEASGDALLARQPLTSWRAAVTAIEQFAAQRSVVVFDEFQCLVQAEPGLPSHLSRWWREKGRHLPLVLILSGSAISFFERDVLGHGSALFGRRTGQLQVTPFGHRDAALFYPRWSIGDRVRAYAVWGGMPYYLGQLDSRAGVRDNILRTTLSRDGVLREEARLLLFQELSEPRLHFSVLRSLAGGDAPRTDQTDGVGDPRPVPALLVPLCVALRGSASAPRGPGTASRPDRDAGAARPPPDARPSAVANASGCVQCEARRTYRRRSDTVAAGDDECGEARRRGRPPKAAPAPPHPGLSVDNPLAELAPAARHVLETARRLLLEEGYGALTVENVALEAGETVGTVKRHFASKAGLVEALLDAVVHDAYVDLTREVEQLPPGDERIHAYITGLHDITVDTEASQAIFEIAPRALRDPVLRERIAALYVWYRELTLREAGILGEDDEARITAEARRRLETLATVVLAALDGLAYQTALDPEGIDSGAALALLDAMVRAAIARPDGG